MQCTVPALPPNSDGKLNLELIQSQMGGQNCHIDIEFEDGTVWLARIRLDDPLLPPKPTRTHIFTSEVATLKFLEKTGVPAPKIYAYCEGVKSTCLRAGRWQVAERQVAKKLMESGRRLRKCINRELFPCI